MANPLHANAVLIRFVMITFLLTACKQADKPVPGAAIAPALALATATSIPMTQTTNALPASGNLSYEQLIGLGENIYGTYCAACHQANGEGNLRLFPALNHNAFVTAGQSTAAVDVVLHGREEMPAFETVLTDQQVAAVVSYIRNAWDNQAPPVSLEKVQEVQRLASFD